MSRLPTMAPGPPEPVEPTHEPVAPAQGPCTEHGQMRAYVAPPALIGRRPLWVGPALLVCFVATALAINPLLRRLTFRYGRLVGELGGVHPFELPKQASVAVRPMTMALLLTFGIFAAGSMRARLRLMLTGLMIYLPLMVAIDVLLARLSRDGAPSPFMARGNIFDGLAGILAICLAILICAKLPENLYVATMFKRPKRYIVIMLASIIAAVATIDALFRFESNRLHWLANVPLLGGVLSVVVLFFALFPFYLCMFGYISERWLLAVRGEHLSDWVDHTRPITFGFLVPAHNEEELIGDTIRSIDAAAAEWPAQTTIYVIENGSTDDTYAEAAGALLACRHARGVLLTSTKVDKTRAKAHALNTGLAAATEDVLVRVDADTFVTPALLPRIAPHFRDFQVGGVGTLPLPHKVTIWIERMRMIEVFYGAAFKRTAQGAVDAIPVLPGAAVAFRREVLVDLNGFSEGILGEDSDITVRVGRLGYRIVSDPALKVYSEQPQNLRALREQRMRWSCGLFHMIGHNRSTISHMQGLRGAWTLPWACFVAFRKLMLIPFAIAAACLIVLGHSLFPLREIAAAGAITLGAQLIVMAVVVSLLAGPANVISLPSYIVFRLIVTYFALETLFTINLKEPRRAGYRSWSRRVRMAVKAQPG